MQVRVLGCSGSIAAGCRTTSFLLDHDVLLDAGTGVGDLSVDALAQIDDILLSHSHLDHVTSVALLADSVMRRRVDQPPIRVHALPQTLHALRAHIFNGSIWPDFTRLPSAADPILRLIPFEVGQAVELSNGRRVEILPAVHTVPAVGFSLQTSSGAWVFSGDTGPNPGLWQRLRAISVRFLVIETAFRNEERDLAHISKHLCPEELHRELAHLEPGAQVFITHIKPGEMEVVMAEIERGGSRHAIRPLVAGHCFDLS